MERLLYKELLTWKKKADRKPLLLQGARQVGKTYLLKEFGGREYKNIAYFNFEQNPDLTELFEASLAPGILIETLGTFLGQKIEPGKTLVFFDEIQAAPRAISSLKYFCEQTPQYHVVAAGSLLGVSVGKSTGFPVGKVSFMTLFPMSFFEYLAASGEEMLLAKLQEHNANEPITEIFHDKLTRLFKYYLYIGGMPEVVQNYINNQDIKRAREIQNEILKAYERDFSKYSSSSEAIRVSEVWRSIPLQLAKENKKFKYGDVKKGARASRFESAIEWLHKAGLIHLVNNIKTPKLPLAAYRDESKFKIYLLDPGLLGAFLDVPSRAIIMGDQLLSQFNGAFTENYVANELAPILDPANLYYWTSKSEAEVDFIISQEGVIAPLEVKSGLSRKTKSLRIYAEKYKPGQLFRTSPRNFTNDGDLTNLPLYAISLITRYLQVP